MLTLGATLQLFAHILRSWLPPFGLFAATFFFAHLGQAYQDAHANTYVSSVKTAHRWLGFIHAMYMAGCLTGPFVATAVASANNPSQWNLFYTFPLGLCTLNVVATAYAFRDTLKLKRKVTSTQDVPQSRSAGAFKEIRETIRLPSVWLLSLFFFFFLGVAITAGGRCACLNTGTILTSLGWVVTYLVDVRKGNLADVGYVPAGFYGGGFLGRLLLAEPTYRFGERRMIFIYAVLCLGLQLCFWLVPSITAGAVTISLLGFFSGPFFATGISVGSKLFPEHVKSSAISLVFVIGQIGGSIFPALTGVIAARAGVRVLQPMLVGLIAATGISWLMLPRTIHRRE